MSAGQAVVVGTKGAAKILGVGVDRVRALVADGTIPTVPRLSTPRRIWIATVELERLVATGLPLPGKPGQQLT